MQYQKEKTKGKQSSIKTGRFPELKNPELRGEKKANTGSSTMCGNPPTLSKSP